MSRKTLEDILILCYLRLDEYDEDDANQEPTILFKEFLAELVLVYQAAMDPGSHAVADER
eukprot:Pgem_evm1s798